MDEEFASDFLTELNRIFSLYINNFRLVKSYFDKKYPEFSLKDDAFKSFWLEIDK